jgi:hypothetical protein
MKKFRRLDIFKKVPSDLSEGTELGGLISLVTASLIIYFTVSEVHRFFNPPQVANIDLDEPFTRRELL